eukprot:9484225-Pyramimonas_sp.AAC.1
MPREKLSFFANDVLRYDPPTSRFREDVSSETLVFKTYLDMNGKRVQSKSLARTCTNIAVACRLGALPDRAQG